MTKRKRTIECVEYLAWAHDVPVENAIKVHGRFIGNRWIRVYYKKTEHGE